MDKPIKYFFHGAIGLLLGQAIGSNFGVLGSQQILGLMPVPSLVLAFGIFGFYVGILWNKGIKFAILGIISGIFMGMILFGHFAPLIDIPIFPYEWYTTLENKFTGLIPPLINIFVILVPPMIVGGLICTGLYYALGSRDANKERDFKNIFIKIGTIISLIWVIFNLVFSFAGYQDARYIVSKVYGNESFVVVDAGEVNKYPYFANTINEIEKTGKQSYDSNPVPREEVNTIRDIVYQKCRSKGLSWGSCHIKINNSFYDIFFSVPIHG